MAHPHGYVLSLDGVGITKVRNNLPRPMQRRINTDNAWVVVDENNRLDCGWYEIAEAARPPDSPTETFERVVVNTAPGVFAETWVHHPEKHAGRIATDTASAQYATLAGEVAWLRGRAAAAANVTVANNNAVNVLQSVVDDLGRFFDRFADKLEADAVFVSGPDQP